MDFLSLIKNVAPMIAGTFGTPLAGLAVKAILSAVPDGHQAEAQEAAAQGPESFLKKAADLFQQGAINTADIKKAELAHAERMAELGYKNAADLAKIDADDRDSARRREMAVKDNTPAVLAYMIIGGFFALASAQLVAIMGYPEVVAKIPGQGWLVIGNISGYLAAEAKAAASYYFGSSSGSKDKDATLAEIAKS